MLNFSKGKWKKNGGFVVAGNGVQTKNATVFKSICMMQGSGVKGVSGEARNNQTLICMAPDMYRTLYAQYVLGWKIYNVETCVGQIWVFEGVPTMNNPNGYLGETKANNTVFPIWSDELIAIFEKELKEHENGKA